MINDLKKISTGNERLENRLAITQLVRLDQHTGPITFYFEWGRDTKIG